MGEFIGLTGVKAKAVPGVVVGSVSAMVDALTKHRVSTAAGDKGCVTAWRDDAGNYRSDFSQWLVTKAEATHTSKAALRAWLRKWFSKCR